MNSRHLAFVAAVLGVALAGATYAPITNQDVAIGRLAAAYGVPLSNIAGCSGGSCLSSMTDVEGAAEAYTRSL